MEDTLMHIQLLIDSLLLTFAVHSFYMLGYEVLWIKAKLYTYKASLFFRRLLLHKMIVRFNRLSQHNPHAYLEATLSLFSRAYSLVSMPSIAATEHTILLRLSVLNHIKL